MRRKSPKIIPTNAKLVNYQNEIFTSRKMGHKMTQLNSAEQNSSTKRNCDPGKIYYLSRNLSMEPQNPLNGKF